MDKVSTEEQAVIDAIVQGRFSPWSNFDGPLMHGAMHLARSPDASMTYLAYAAWCFPAQMLTNPVAQMYALVEPAFEVVMRAAKKLNEYNALRDKFVNLDTWLQAELAVPVLRKDYLSRGSVFVTDYDFCQDCECDEEHEEELVENIEYECTCGAAEWNDQKFPWITMIEFVNKLDFALKIRRCEVIEKRTQAFVQKLVILRDLMGASTSETRRCAEDINLIIDIAVGEGSLIAGNVLPSLVPGMDFFTEGVFDGFLGEQSLKAFEIHVNRAKKVLGHFA